MNRQNYFEYDGQKYYTGTVIKVRDWSFPGDQNKIVELVFVYIIIESGRYVFSKIGGPTKGPQSGLSSVPKEMFPKILVEVTDRVDLKVHMPVKKYRKDSEIQGMLIGWLWYIFIMAIAVIFKDRIGIWILTSIVFFLWRHKKKEQSAHYWYD